MKKLLLAFLIPFMTNGQILNDDNGVMYFEQVYELPDKSQEDLHSKVNEWIAINFNNSNHVIKINTPDKIVNNGISKSTYTYKGVVVELTNAFDMITEFKEGRYRLKIDNITYKTPKSSPAQITFNNEELDKEAFKEEFIKLVDNMEDGYVKKYNQKILKSDKKFDEHWENVKLARTAIYSSVSQDIEAIASSLSSYVEKELQKNEEW